MRLGLAPVASRAGRSRDCCAIVPPVWSLETGFQRADTQEGDSAQLSPGSQVEGKL